MSKNKNSRNVNREESETSERSAGNVAKNKTNKNRKGGSRKPFDSDSANRFRNDASWYIPDTMLREQLTNYAFNQFVGYPFSIGSERFKTFGADTVQFTVPSICRIGMNPGIGWVPKEFAAVSGINLAAQAMYTKFSSINAKTTKYAQQDLATLILALGNLLALYSHIRRIFGCAYLVNARNRDIPLQFFNAFGIDFSDFKTNLSDYRLRYNTIITAAQKIPFPVNISYFAKCTEIFTDIFCDDESSMAQLYILCPNHVWQLHEAGSPQGSTLAPISVENPGDMNVLLNIFEETTECLLHSSTLNDIYSDILNYAGKVGTPLWHFELCGEAETRMPIYNRNYLEMIHNLRTFGNPVPFAEIPESLVSASAYELSDGLTVRPDASKNTLWANPVFKGNGGVMDTDIILDFFDDNPDTDRRVDATKFTGTARHLGTVDNVDYFSEAELSDWYPAAMHIYSGGVANVVLTTMTRNASDLQKALLLTKFKRHPMVFIIASRSNPTIDGTIGDLEYFTTVDGRYIRRINDASYMGLMTLRDGAPK